MSRLKKIAYTEGKYELIDIQGYSPMVLVFSYKISDELMQQQIDEMTKDYYDNWLFKQLDEATERGLTNNKELRKKLLTTHANEFEFYEHIDEQGIYGKENEEYNLTNVHSMKEYEQIEEKAFSNGNYDELLKIIKVPALMTAIDVEFNGNPKFDLDTNNKLLYMKS